MKFLRNVRLKIPWGRGVANAADKRHATGAPVHRALSRVLPPVLVVVVAAGGWQLWRATPRPSSPADDEPFAALLAAVAATGARPVDGRLGSMDHAPPPARLRGPGGDDIAPAVRIAAARLEQAWRAQPVPRASARLGVAALALRDWDRAIELLREAADAEPRNAQFQSDLSAAYLARGAAMDAVEDWANGLAAAARAIAVVADDPAAHFNRALALDGLRLPLSALDAWQEYARYERPGPWLDEAAGRGSRLRRQPLQIGAILDDAEVNTQPLREEIEDRLLPQWGEALLAGRDADAARLLGDAERKAGELAALRGDTMAADQIALARRLGRLAAHRQMRRLAQGSILYGRARRAFVTSNLEGAADLMEDAAAAFRQASSRYGLWGPVYRAIHLRYRRQPDRAIALLKGLPIDRLPRTYHNLRGRVAWTEGVMWGASGRPDLERGPIERAIEEFRTARERDHQIMTTTLLAETEWFLGDATRAWTSLGAAFALVGDRDWTNRNYHFIIGALIATGVDLPEVALEFLNSRLRLPETPQSRGEAFLQRARLHAARGDTRASAADLDRAVEAFARIDDAKLREFIGRDIDIARAELFSRTDCRRAMQYADNAYPGVAAATHTIRIVGLLAVRARCRQELGDLAGARRDLAEAARAFECRRQELGSDLDRIRAFEQERTAFKALMTLEAVAVNDVWAGLQTAERSRAGVLTETWRTANSRAETEAPRDGVSCRSAAVPVAAESVRLEQLPGDVAVIYYESLDDRVLTWVLTRDTREMLSAPITSAQLRRMVSGVQRAVRQGANLAALRPHSAPLYDTLIAPALGAIHRAAERRSGREPSTVFFVPDGPLYAVPFGALPDARGEPLVRTRAVGVAPSLLALVAASARLTSFVPKDVLAIGDGHDPSASGLSHLPGADAEAADVGRLYSSGAVLTGLSATTARVLAERRSVVHFAGHTVVNRYNPRFSQMLLAPDPANGDSGRLLASEITAARFAATGVVVLATCDGAAGPLIDGEGAISVARAFFAAGVPAVVASLWPVVDGLPAFAQTFHLELRRGRSATDALRTAQLALLDARGPDAPVSVWGGFILFGGQGPVH